MDSSGAIWAIPYSNHITMFGRAINKKWLSNSNLDVPQTVNELYNLFQDFTYNDPDRNGANDTFAVSIALNKGMLEFKDIFEANGCYLTYQSWFPKDSNREIYFSVPVGYNPLTGRIEDSINKQGMMESLDFLEYVVKNKLVSIDYNDIVNGEFTNKNVGTHIHVLNDKVLNDNYEYIYALTGLNTEFTSSLFMDGEGAYFLSTEATDPEVIVPAFIDTFYGSDQGYKVGHYGILGSQYKYSETKYGIVMNNVDNTIKPHIEAVGELSWRKPTEMKAINDKKAVDMENLLKDDRFFLINQKCMAFGERTLVVLLGNEESGMNYQKQINNVFRILYSGDINAVDAISEMNRIHNYYDIEQQINEINLRWFGK